MIKFLFSKLHNVGVLAHRKNIDDLVSSIFEITKSHSQYNKTIEKFTLREDYYLTIVSIIKQQNNLSLLNLTKVLHTLRCVRGLRNLNDNEQVLRDIVLNRAPNLLTQPFSTVCDTYCNIALLQGNTDIYAEKILNEISDQIQEVDFLKIQRAMLRRNLSSLEQEIIKKMQKIDVFKYTIPARIRIFRYYAEMQTLHRAPFYDQPEQQRQIENKTKKLIQFTIPDVYISYQSICNGFPDKMLKLANQQLTADNCHQNGPFNFEQFNLFSLCLREASKIESLYQAIDWDSFLKEYIYQLQSLSPDIPSHLSLNLFGRIFMDKINEDNAYLLTDIVQIVQKHSRLMKNINFIQFMYFNRNILPQNTMTQFMEIFNKIPYEKKDSLIFNYISQKLGFKKIDFQQSFYSNLRTLSQNCICDDDYSLEYCQQIQPKDQKFLLNHLDIITSSICGVKTLQFWQEELFQITKIDVLQTCLEELLSNNCLDFPNYYNYYQLKLFLWILGTFKLPPFVVAPYFYRKLSKNIELSTDFIQFLEKTDLHTALVIWEQMECPPMFLHVLTKIFDKTKVFKLTPPILRFIKSNKPNFTDEQSKVIATVFNLKP